MKNDDRLIELRALPVWSEAVEPVLKERLQFYRETMDIAADLLTVRSIQGSIAAIKYLIGDPEADTKRETAIAAMNAEHAKHLYTEQDDQEEEDIDNAGRSGFGQLGNARNARLAEQRGYSAR